VTLPLTALFCLVYLYNIQLFPIIQQIRYNITGKSGYIAEVDVNRCDQGTEGRVQWADSLNTLYQRWHSVWQPAVNLHCIYTFWQLN